MNPYLSFGLAMCGVTAISLFFTAYLAVHFNRRAKADLQAALTPLGDPPLFLGFLKGVPFFWPTRMLFFPMMLVVVILLAIFYLIDRAAWRREDPPAAFAADEPRFRVEGTINLLLLAGIVLSVLLSGVWRPGTSFTVYHVEVELQHLVRDALLLALAYASWKLTPPATREANDFAWFPIIEVAKLFAGIFITIIPAIAILRAGTAGALAPVVEAVSRDGEPVDAMYFWAAGILSSFLDNAPTYLVFFNTAGGDAALLTGPMASTLVGWLYPCTHTASKPPAPTSRTMSQFGRCRHGDAPSGRAALAQNRAL